MTERWNPAEFKDTYHEDLMARIKEKIKQGQTKEITKPGSERRGRAALGAGHRPRRASEAEPRQGAAATQASARSERRAARSKPALRVVGSAKSSAEARRQERRDDPPRRRKRA